VSLFGRPGDLNRQFIARPDTAKEDMLFKWPDLTIRKFMQVTVEPDETAISVGQASVGGIHGSAGSLWVSWKAGAVGVRRRKRSRQNESKQGGADREGNAESASHFGALKSDGPDR
jgi:hypothetical protein